MFTGIITEIGEIVSAETEGGWLRLSVHGNATAARAHNGSSVAISGVCLTVNSNENGVMNFTVLPETLTKTVLGSWQSGVHVNLENALHMGDEIGGHMVYGHVDGVAHISAIAQEGASTRMTIELPEPLRMYRAPKGSIAVDGVSLTLASMDSTSFDVALVEYTLAHTTLGNKRVGDKVHIECDMMLKYLSERLAV